MTTPDSQSATTLIACFITAASTLSGVALTNWFNARSLRLNLAEQARQKLADRRLAKLEELYVLFEKWEINFAQVYLAHLRCYTGKLSFAQVLELTKSSDMLLPGEHQKMMMLLNVHFPELLAKHAAVEAGRGEIAVFLRDPAETQLKSSEFVARQEEFETECRIFKAHLAESARPT